MRKNFTDLTVSDVIFHRYSNVPTMTGPSRIVRFVRGPDGFKALLRPMKGNPNKSDYLVGEDDDEVFGQTQFFPIPHYRGTPFIKASAWKVMPNTFTLCAIFGPTGESTGDTHGSRHLYHVVTVNMLEDTPPSLAWRLVDTYIMQAAAQEAFDKVTAP
jgi:hypothetical protein